ncbi:MAG: hypothetical protein HRT54_12850 [Colwellia sp.]|nr:hypothetical protein [Colwellia sp.]
MNYLKLILISLTLLLTACGDDENGDIKTSESPEDVSVAFFNAIYNEKDVKKAAKVCSPQLSRIILHYKSPRAVARHLFNMSYDSVVASPDDSGVKIREQFKGAAIITVYFDGIYDNNRVKDVKRLSLIQVNGDWIIDKILKDPF